MGKYIKLFETHAEYQTYINGSDKILPNVSYCEDNNDVHYNPWVETKLVCKYNIIDTSSATALRTEYEQNMFKSMEIDGVLLDSLVTEYQFSTTGEHTVKYELYDETKVGNNTPLFFHIAILTSVSIPNSVTTIGINAFNGCSGLTSITIPNSVTSIGDNAFQNCTSLTSITIGNGVTYIGTAAFTGCTGLTSITIPNSVTTIGSSAFYGCSGLTSIEIPNTVTSIGTAAFAGCTGLTSVTIDTTTVQEWFRSNTHIQTVVLGDGVTSIGTFAFQDCSGLTNVTISNSVTSIGDSAFSGCISLTSIEIPNSVTSIGSAAFYDCTSFTSITIPSGVTSIGTYAFNGCTSLTSITIQATTPPTLGDTNAFTDTNNCPIYVPSASVEAYKSATNWSSLASRIQAIPTT